MSAATLNDVFKPALEGRFAIAGLVVLGWEDARLYVEAADETGLPIILHAGPACRRHTPVQILGKMFRHLAEQSRVPIVCHIDHAKTYEECAAALDAGFTSLMIDGSALPYDENVALTRRVVELARPHGLSVEGEIGAVGYSGGAASSLTDADEAGRFARDTGVDALAVSVGNLHLQTEHAAIINRDLLSRIEAVTSIPLVIHGGSGVDPAVRRQLSKETRVKKFNIGTELRQEFGRSLRAHLAAHPTEFDRIKILTGTVAPMRHLAAKIIRDLGP
jgi:fructose-bisphosphate aldolase class II